MVCAPAARLMFRPDRCLKLSRGRRFPGGCRYERREARLHLADGALERSELRFVRALRSGGINEAPVNAFGSTGEDGALLGGGVAHRDDVIERLSLKLGAALGSFLRTGHIYRLE